MWPLEGLVGVIMRNFQEKFRLFMVGRYGGDQLGNALVWTLLIMCLIRVLGLHRGGLAYGIMGWVIIVLLAIFYLRFFSRDIARRRRENEIFLHYSFHVAEAWKKFKFQLQEHRKYHIFKCPTCKQKVRIPRGHGRVSIHCPKCGTDFIRKS